MKLKDTFVTQEMDGEQVMVEADGGFAGMVRSNATAAFIIDQLKTETTKEAILDAMEKKYDASRAVMTEDVDMVLGKGIGLLDKLDELYKTYGYCLNTLHSYEFDGSAGFAKMQSIMQAFRGNIKEFGGKKVVELLDYAPGLDGLPKSDVLKFLLEDNCSIVVRPSGTEPKLKTYISVSAE